MLSRHSDELIGSSEQVYKLGGLVIPPNLLLTTSLQSLVERKCIVDKLDSGIKEYMNEFINQVSFTKEQVLNSIAKREHYFFSIEPFDIFGNKTDNSHRLMYSCIKKKYKESNEPLCELIDNFNPKNSKGYIKFIIDYDNMSIIPISLTGHYIFEENNSILSLLDKRTRSGYKTENTTFTLKHQFCTATNKYLKTVHHNES